MDEMKMVPSHGAESGETSLTPDELKYLAQQHFGDVKDIVDNLTPQERAIYEQNLTPSAGAPGLSPKLLQPMLAGMGNLSGLLKYAPAMSGLGAAAKSGIGGYLGWKGGEAVGSAIGLPPWAKELLSVGGAMIGGHGKGGSPAAQTAEEAAAAKLGVNVDRLAPKTMPDGGPMTTMEELAKTFRSNKVPPNVEKLGREDFNAIGNEPTPSLGGLDTAGLRSQPNVNLKRNVNDVREAVTGSSRNNYADPRSSDLEYDENSPENLKAVSDIAKKLKSKLKVRPK